MTPSQEQNGATRQVCEDTKWSASQNTELTFFSQITLELSSQLRIAFLDRIHLAVEEQKG